MSHQEVLDELKKLITEPDKDDASKAPPPELADVLYVDPTTGGEPRNCSNCVMWGSSDERCSIMPEHETTKYHVCGYHVFGKPSKRRIEFEGISPPDPKYAGLVEARDGACCRNCDWSTQQDEEDYVCRAVTKRKKLAHVHPSGCCARWLAKKPITETP